MSRIDCRGQNGDINLEVEVDDAHVVIIASGTFGKR